MDQADLLAERALDDAVVECEVAYPAVEADGKWREARPEVRGRLLYCRNVMTTQAPWDVVSLDQRDPSFPDTPTSQQLFAEQQFEGYRVLGCQAAAAAVRTAPKR